LTSHQSANIVATDIARRVAVYDTISTVLTILRSHKSADIITTANVAGSVAACDSVGTAIAIAISPIRKKYKARKMFKAEEKRLEKEIKEYKELVHQFAKEIQEMDLPDDFHKISAFRVLLHEKHGISYSVANLEYDSYHMGLDILSKKGCCRHTAQFEADVAKEMGLDATVVYVEDERKEFEESDIQKTMTSEDYLLLIGVEDEKLQEALALLAKELPVKATADDIMRVLKEHGIKFDENTYQPAEGEPNHAIVLYKKRLSLQ